MVYSDSGRCAVPDPAARSQFRLTSVQTAKDVTSRSRDLRGRQANLIRIVSLARSPLAHVGIFLLGLRDVFKTRRGIIQNKSELGIRAESSRPELSSPFEMEECQVTRAGKTKKQKY